MRLPRLPIHSASRRALRKNRHHDAAFVLRAGVVSQLALPIGLADHAVFASFHAVGNEAAVAHLEAVAAGDATGGALLRGPAGSGKSHLLQATCAAAGDDAVFLPAGLLQESGTALLEGLEARRVICLDDVDVLMADAAWERALFVLFNELQAHGGQLVAAASAALRAWGVGLPDLESRLSQLPVFALQALREDERLAALRLRAAQRGLELPDDVARFLMARVPRDMGSLQSLLETLDRRALQAQRRLTVPFVRRVLEQRD
jgi:DnaA-homolog protein